MKIEYIDHMGSDLTVVNAARVSFDKHHEMFDADKDTKLINYLAKHEHFTPFTHVIITLRVTVPICIANQLKRHQIGLTVNEVSRRYVDSEPDFYFPKKFGVKAENKKQGAKEDEFITSLTWGSKQQRTPDEFLKEYYDKALWGYNFLLSQGVAPEDARMLLPQAMYTSWYWTGSLAAYARIYKLRINPHAQRQSGEIAIMISNIIEPLFPVSWKALTR